MECGAAWTVPRWVLDSDEGSGHEGEEVLNSTAAVRFDSSADAPSSSKGKGPKAQGRGKGSTRR